jgi:hypothetical protein
MKSYPSAIPIIPITFSFLLCSMSACTAPASEEQTLFKRNLELLDSIKNEKAREHKYLQNLPQTSDLDTIYDYQHHTRPAIPYP